jgi:hypothetical protein
MKSLDVAVKYIVTWKSSQEPKRKEAHFDILHLAESWYNEKLEEDKNPSIFMEETAISRRKLK